MTILSPLTAAALVAASWLQAAPQSVQPQTPAPQAGTSAVPAPAAKPPATATPAAATTDADPALWEVKDRDTTIYLFGTIHILKPGLSWFDEAVKAAFDRSTELRLEMVMPEGPAVQAEALKAGTLPEGQTLTAKLPEPARAKLTQTLAQYRIPAGTFDRYTPWFTANNLTVLPLMKLGYKLDAGAEKVLTAAAKAEGKSVTGFETFTEQLGFFTALSEPAQVELLTSTLDEIDQIGPHIDAMVTDWGRGDPAALAKLLNDDLEKNRELSEKLLYQRNARWATWIKARMAQPGTVFIAVGAGHLAGDRSVQELLKKQGLKVRRVAY